MNGVFGLLSAGRTEVPVHMYEFFEPSVSITRQLLPSLKYQHLSPVRVYKGARDTYSACFVFFTDTF